MAGEMLQTFYPQEIDTILNNPFMGWVPWATAENPPQPHRLVYAGISWRELEPKRGQFDWEGVERKYRFQHWTEQKVKFVLRIVLDLPRRGEPTLDIPDWLFELTEGRGTWYETTEVGNGFSPDYNDPVFIKEHERLIAALAERYNEDPRIAFIQLGSLGHWGEWHCWPPGSGVFPEIAVSDLYVTHYLKTFTKKMIGLRRPFGIAKENKLGLFNDMFGHKPSTDEWIGWFREGRSKLEPAMEDFWKHAYSGGEFSSGRPLLHLGDDKIADTLRQARESHTSWLGPCSPAILDMGIPEQKNLDALLKTLGYRFVLETITHRQAVEQDTTLPVALSINNKGVAPFYFRWPLYLALAEEKGQILNIYQTELDLRQLLPGKTDTVLELPIQASTPPGTYTLVLAILDPDLNEPGIDLAITGRREDGWYSLSKLIVD